MPPLFILAFATPFVLALAPAVLPTAFLFASPPAAGAITLAATAPTPVPELPPELRDELNIIARDCHGTVTGSPSALTTTCADGTTVDYNVPPAHPRGVRFRLVGSPSVIQEVVSPSFTLEDVITSCHDDSDGARILTRRDDDGARCEFGGRGYLDWSATNDGRTHIVGELYEPLP